MDFWHLGCFYWDQSLGSLIKFYAKIITLIWIENLLIPLPLLLPMYQAQVQYVHICIRMGPFSGLPTYNSCRARVCQQPNPTTLIAPQPTPILKIHRLSSTWASLIQFSQVARSDSFNEEQKESFSNLREEFYFHGTTDSLKKRGKEKKTITS